MKYVYSGWNPLAELKEADNSLIRSYIWGLDDTGAIDESVGVGGLVAVVDAVHGVHFVLSDGQGNVAGLVKASDGSRSATYEYDAFGRTLRKTGSAIADVNPFRYAGRYTDLETDLIYYGFRYYSAELGQWLSRDPLGEWSGPNLYAFVGNDPLNYDDMLGLIDWAALGCIGKGLGKNLLGQVEGLAGLAINPIGAGFGMAQGLATAIISPTETYNQVSDAINEAIEQYAASDAGCIDPCMAREMEGQVLGELATLFGTAGLGELAKLGKLKELAKLRALDELKLAAKRPGIPDSGFTWNPIEWYKNSQIMKRAREAGINVLRSPEGLNAGLINGQPSIVVSPFARSTVAIEEYLHARYLQMVGPQKATALLANNVNILKHEVRLKNIMIHAGKRGTLGSKPLPVDVDFLIDTRIGYSADLSAELGRRPR